jgi:rare lipoprotein A (peptidoglycan hydrolase)
VALLFAGLLCLAAFATTRDGDEGVREVSGVRHSGAVEVPGRVSSKALSNVPSRKASPEAADEAREMVASYYGYSLAGEPTASGEPFDPEGYTAAHKSLPLGTELSVGYGGESVRVVVNDRGPYVAGRDIDLSLAAAREIGLTGPGEAPVRVVLL